MILINFSHPFTTSQMEALGTLLGGEVGRVVDVKTHFDQQVPFEPQVAGLIDSVGLSSHDWQTLPLMVVTPSLAPIAALLLAELHGRMGYFPPVVRLRPVADALPPRFEVAEILRLQEVRDRARGGR